MKMKVMERVEIKGGAQEGVPAPEPAPAAKAAVVAQQF